jgi:protein-tyrosine phosphatase
VAAALGSHERRHHGYVRELAPFGVFNLRDVGGLRTADGRVVRDGVLLRSDSLHRVPAEEAAVLTQLGVATVVDLRSASELADLGVSDLPMTTVHMPLFTDARTTDLGELTSLEDLYIAMLDFSGANIAAVINRIAEPGALPALIHCTAGKDRTGLVVGLLLSAIGVTDAEVADDYARTTDAMDASMGWLADNDPAGHEHLTSRPAWVLGSEAATMLRVLSNVREGNGTVATWLQSVGVHADALERLSGALLAPT